MRCSRSISKVLKPKFPLFFCQHKLKLELLPLARPLQPPLHRLVLWLVLRLVLPLLLVLLLPLLLFRCCCFVSLSGDIQFGR